MDYVDLGSRIRKKRLQLGWTQEALAKAIGVSTSFVGHLERGSRKASLETLVAAANALNVSLDYLLAASLDQKWESLQQPDGLRPGQRLAMREMLTTLQQQLSNWNDPEE